MTPTAKLAGTLVLAWLGMASCQASASTITLLDTTPPLSPFGASLDSSFPGDAVQFTSAAAVTITEVQAYIRRDDSSTGNIELGIMADASNQPSGSFSKSTTVSSFPTTVASPSTPIDLTSLDWSISAGTYWLVAMADTGFSGSWNQPLSSSAQGAQLNAGQWGQVSAMAAVVKASDVAATPLPAALPLFASSLCGLGLLRWGRRKKPAA